MNVQPMYMYNTDRTHYSPTFGDCAKRSADAAESMIRHYTYLGRDFYVSIDRLTDYVIDLIKKGSDKCEFIFCGCSDGSEVFQIMMSLISRMKKRGIPIELLPKFTAFDIDPYMVNVAKNGRINISDCWINNYQPIYSNIKFFGEEGPLLKHPNDDLAALEKVIGPITHSYQFDKELLKKIEFKTGDMLEEFSKLDDRNCKILFCRNVAQYTGIPYQKQAAEALNKNMKPGSLVIVAPGDECRNFVERHKNDKWENYITLPFCQTLNHNNGGRFAHEYYLSPLPQSVVYIKGDKFLSLY